jgi:hypothetical protein
MERDDFGVPAFDQARRRVAKRKANPGVDCKPLARSVKPRYVPDIENKNVNTLTPDDVVATDHAGNMQCDDCKKWAVIQTMDGTDSAYTCTECGVVSTMAVLIQGFVAPSSVTSQEQMDKRALKGGFTCSEQDAKLEKRKHDIRSSKDANEKEERKAISKYLSAKRRERKVELAKTEFKINEAVTEVLTRIGFDSNKPIIKRASEICAAYIKDRAPTYVIRYPLACASVARAAMENGYGFRAWDFTSFLKDHVEDSVTIRSPSAVFSHWRRDLGSKFKWPEIDRREQLKAFVATFTNRAVVKNTVVSVQERIQISSLTRWIGDARLNRLNADEKKERKDDTRKLRCLPLFFQLLPKPSADGVGCPFEDLKAYLPNNKQKGDECIRIWSMAATIIYITLSMRTKNALTQKHVEQITGVREHVLIACKKIILNAIAKAMKGVVHGQASAPAPAVAVVKKPLSRMQYS